MSKVLGVIGARLNSSRLPGKHLLDLADKPLIARLFERLEKIPELDAIVLATTADEYNQPLVQWAQQAEMAAFKAAGVARLALNTEGAVEALVELMTNANSAKKLAVCAGEKMNGCDGAVKLASRVMALLRRE